MYEDVPAPDITDIQMGDVPTTIIDVPQDRPVADTAAGDGASCASMDAASCPMRANSTASCNGGHCAYSCQTGFADCDGLPETGCEVMSSSDAQNCGACGNACPSRTNAPATCQMGVCVLHCSGGYADCDHNATNGCEANTTMSAQNCGTCGSICAGAPNAHGVCNGGTCAIACDSGFGDCDGNTANGCETDTRADANNCGACHNVCASTMPVCMDGMCHMSALTDAGTDVLDAGGCVSSSCPPVMNATPVCDADGGCAFTCNAGYADCNGALIDGCETHTATDLSNCGACAMQCTGATNATAVCNAGVCGLMCSGGYQDCNRNASDGCEVNTTMSTNNCGTCGSVCAPAMNAQGVCTGGTCTIACNAGFGNCDGDTSNGCETDLRFDANNCGSCHTVCSSTQPVCMSGVCAAQPAMDGGTDAADVVGCDAAACPAAPNAIATCDVTNGCGFTCQTGYADCNSIASDGCETHVYVDLQNCGACTNICMGATNATATCSFGVCGLACTGGYEDCNQDPTDGCEVNVQMSATHCGTCSTVCATEPNAYPVCSGGTCTIGCLPGWGNCDADTSNGCETDLTSTSTACGSCGHICPAATPSCAMGACQ